MLHYVRQKYNIKSDRDKPISLGEVFHSIKESINNKLGNITVAIDISNIKDLLIITENIMSGHCLGFSLSDVNWMIDYFCVK